MHACKRLPRTSPPAHLLALVFVILGAGAFQAWALGGLQGFLDATAQVPADAAFTADLAWIDLEGDGDLDLALASGFFQGNRLYRNVGGGSFVDVSVGLPPDTDLTQAVVAGDVDGDGDADVVFGNHSGQTNRLLRNDGTGVFAEIPGMLPADTDSTMSLALADVDADGDLDLLAGNSSTTDRLWGNDGFGNFTDVTAAQLPAFADNNGDVALDDLDGDGDPDAFIANLGAQDRFYRNDGAGTFTDATALLPADTDLSAAVALADVDGDGSLDVVLVTLQAQNRLYVAVQGPPSLIAVSPVSGGLAGGDPVTISGSGFLTGVVPGSTSVMFERPSATNLTVLSDAAISATIPMQSSPGPVAVSVSNSNGTSTLPASFVYSPAVLTDGPAQVGSTVGFLVYGSTGEMDVGFLGFGELSIPLSMPPFGGTFCLDPSFPLVSFFTGTILTVPQPAASLSIPANPLLIGFSFFVQALIGPDILAGNAMFSNCLTVTITS